jgi:Tol biopolymer transport system component
MNRRATHLALTLLALAVVGAAAVEAASAPGKNGRIVFRRHLDTAKTTGAIFTMNPDGTKVKQVTHVRGGVNDTEPDWSADGTKLAFVRQTRCPPEGPRNGLNGTCDLVYTASADGGDLRLLVPCGFKADATFPGNCVGVSHPAWSPDGSKLAFQYNLVDRRYPDSLNVQAGIWISDASGGNARQVTQRAPGRWWDYGAQWSPDGKRLAFFRLDVKTQREAIYTVAIDGSDERRVTPVLFKSAANPNWSPDGRWLLFTGEKRDGSLNLFKIHPDGSGLINLTKQPAGGFQYLGASFSPDGTMIASARSPGVRSTAADVVVMRADGTKARWLTKTKLWDSGADWGRAPVE